MDSIPRNRFRQHIQPGGPVRQPYLMYRPARLNRLAETIPQSTTLFLCRLYQLEQTCICLTRRKKKQSERGKEGKQYILVSACWQGKVGLEPNIHSQASSLRKIAASLSPLQQKFQSANGRKNDVIFILISEYVRYGHYNSVHQQTDPLAMSPLLISLKNICELKLWSQRQVLLPHAPGVLYLTKSWIRNCI